MSDYPRDQQDAYELDQRHRKQAEEPRGVELSADAASDALSAFLRKKLAAADLEASHNLGHDFDCPGCGWRLPVTLDSKPDGDPKPNGCAYCGCEWAPDWSADARKVTVREWFRASRRATYDRDMDAWRKWIELSESVAYGFVPMLLDGWPRRRNDHLRSGFALSVADIQRTPAEGQRRAKEILDGMAADFRRDIPNMFEYLGRGGAFYRGRKFRGTSNSRCIDDRPTEGEAVTVQNAPNVVALRDELAEFIRARMPWTWADIDRDGGEALDTALLMAEPIAANLAAEFAEMRDDQGYVPLMPQLRASVRDATEAERRMIAAATGAPVSAFTKDETTMRIRDGVVEIPAECDEDCAEAEGHCKHGRSLLERLGVVLENCDDGCRRIWRSTGRCRHGRTSAEFKAAPPSPPDSRDPGRRQ